ncbi:peptidylprolyl isomerase SurA [Idiomarina tyrosinivorans]|uniref:Chaperone SurA n=1 Tax=Idiomarina tyrosinivorans TaxID=1445662 RepID=A0A432ZS01_9GAMM|nr:peptidylprolyl isomerase SurA [Idiomarina tyrosinivorans]RUO80690.1 peptidylprolyl isomerase SurA [Idiomarina tyrosinivorans]
MKRIFLAFSLMAVALSSSFSAAPAQAQQVLDRVAVIVDENVILESQIDQLVAQVKRRSEQAGQPLPSEKVLRSQAIERLVLQELQLQMAKRMGIEISDAQLDQTINRIAADQGMTVAELRQDVTSDGTSWAAYRENVRTEILTGQVQRAAVQRRVSVTSQEVDSLVDLIDEQGANTVEYHLRQILIPAQSGSSQKAIDAAEDKANNIISELNNGGDFAAIAISRSAGNNALDGGDLGWMSTNEMPTLFADAVDGKSEGAIIGPIRSGIGFHILQVEKIRGQQQVKVQEVKARHILIKPSVILSDEKAKERLQKYRQQIISGEKTFAELAKEHSADPGSASRGGDLGWSRPARYAPEFAEKVKTLDVGTVSEPFKTQFGWHIVQVEDRRMLDATQESKRDKAYQILFSRKYREELNTWLQEIRDQAYVEEVEK